MQMLKMVNNAAFVKPKRLNGAQSIKVSVKCLIKIGVALKNTVKNRL